MTSRVLPPAEWPRLHGTELGEVYHLLDPERARIIVVEDADEIVGCWAIFPVFHVEGVWISDRHRRRSSVAKRLLTMMGQMIKLAGVETVVTASASEDVDRLIQHLRGVELPRHFSIPVEALCPRSL